MKSDPITLVLYFVLAAFIGLNLTFAIIMNNQMTRIPELTAKAQNAGSALMRLQALGNDVNTYNATAKSPELARILQSIQTKPAAPAK